MTVFVAKCWISVGSHLSGDILISLDKIFCLTKIETFGTGNIYISINYKNLPFSSPKPQPLEISRHFWQYVS